LLSIFLNEIDFLRSQSQCELTLIHCDAAIQRVDSLSPFEDCGELTKGFIAHGRGGTDFRPVFQWVENEVRSGGIDCPDAIIYLTDGYGSFPERAPDMPVLWVCAPGTTKPEEYPFGACLQIE